MPDEVKTEPKNENTTETKFDWRDGAREHGIFDKMSALQKEIEFYKSKEAEKARAEQEARIKTEEDLKAFKKQMQDEIAAEKAKAAADVRLAKAEALVAGIQDPWKRKGLLAELISLAPESDMSVHLEGLKKSDPSLFENLPFSPAVNPPQGGRAANSSADNWGDIKSILRTGYTSNKKQASIEETKNAVNKLAEYRATHGGQAPEGW